MATLGALFCSFGLFAASGFVSDDVYAYLHSGPSTKYRIVGSITAGAPIQILKRSDDGKFRQIKDEKGRTGWLKVEFTSTKPSIREHAKKLQQQVTKLEKQDVSSSDALEKAHSRVKKLEHSLNSANKKLQQAQDSERRALSQLKGEDEQLKMQWAINGGMLVGISILFGVVLTFIPKKKKKSSNWS
jgi:SH3 domain protein